MIGSIATLSSSGLRPAPASGLLRDTVFDRFAGVFHAFEQLRSWIDTKLEANREVEVTARLFGEKYDSLPVLLQKTLDREEGDDVIRYVTFLSALQVVAYVRKAWPEYWAANGSDGAKLGSLCERVEEIRDQLLVADPDRAAFLSWYHEAFVTPASELEALDA